MVLFKMVEYEEMFGLLSARSDLRVAHEYAQARLIQRRVWDCLLYLTLGRVLIL